MRNIDHDVQLLRAYLKGEINYDSHAELRILLNEHPQLVTFLNQLKSEKGLSTMLEQFNAFDELRDEDSGYEKDLMLQKILVATREEKQKPNTSTIWRRTIIAASILLVLGIGLTTFPYRQKPEEELTSINSIDFKPGTNKAFLSSSDGKTIELDSSFDAIVVGESIHYNDGSKLFEGTALEKDINLTLYTPRGGQYQITLSDGTRVWLNAESKITYPKRFIGHKRIVELHGEAYFEVASQTGKPFIVQTAHEEIEVLGTHFNVYSYPEETLSTVALIEGKVKVSLPNNQFKLLNPGEQSRNRDMSIIKEKIDIQESLAWKNGEFMFNNEPLKSVMNKLARWYNIEIEIDPEIQDLLIWGSVSRYNNFNEVLEIIKMTDEKIRFTTKGRRVSLMK